MYRTLVIIGIGSFLGGISRYLVQQYVQRYFPSAIPWGTFSVNITGCFLIGVIYALATRGNLLSPEWRLFLATGFCGGFTTFSTFAYENVSMVFDREYYYTAIYILLSVVLGFGAVHAGILSIKILFKP